MQSQPCKTRDLALAFHWPVWPVLAIAFFAFAVNVAFARAAVAGESASDESEVAEQANADTRNQRREARIATFFGRADANEDGRVSAEEFAAVDIDRAMRRGGGQRMRPRERGPRMGGKPGERDFEAADTDGSGALSPQEFDASRREARRKRVFERMDNDGDGYLTVDEFTARMLRPRRASGAKGRGDGSATNS